MLKLFFLIYTTLTLTLIMLALKSLIMINKYLNPKKYLNYIKNRILDRLKPIAINLIKRNYAYQMEHLICGYNWDFINNDLFLKGYSKAMDVDPSPGWPEKKWQINQIGAWVIYTTQWAAKQALTLDGDFVECGTYKGRHAISILESLNWNEKKRGKKFYLFDTFYGLDEIISSKEEVISYKSSYKDFSYESVKDSFNNFENIIITKGIVPTSLKELDISKVCFLHIDMNSVRPEVSALEYFWPKLVKNAIVIFDDYGQPGHEKQKSAIDRLCRELGRDVYTIPTGQGLLIK